MPAMKRCLIVDGSSVIRKVARRILGSAHLLVLEAASGGDALAICSHSMPEIVVVDASLTDIDAIELIRRIKALPAATKPRILLCLTGVDVGAIMRAKRAGAQDYVLKPFDREQLLARFERNIATAA
jgi:two-component system chemotaxis response regulator CheY